MNWTGDNPPQDERRKFERIDIPFASQVLVLDAKGEQAGVLRQLGRGGFMMESEKFFKEDVEIYHWTIHEPHENIYAGVSARLRFAEQRFVGFEFEELSPEAAVEVGIIIGKYYEHAKA